MSKNAGGVRNDLVTLEVIECDCGFHLGLDSTYLEQVGPITIECPVCGNVLSSIDILGDYSE